MLPGRASAPLSITHASIVFVLQGSQRPEDSRPKARIMYVLMHRLATQEGFHGLAAQRAGASPLRSLISLLSRQRSIFRLPLLSARAHRTRTTHHRSIPAWHILLKDNGSGTALLAAPVIIISCYTFSGLSAMLALAGALCQWWCRADVSTTP